MVSSRVGEDGVLKGGNGREWSSVGARMEC